MNLLSSTFQGGKNFLKKGLDFFTKSEKPSAITDQEKEYGINWQLVHFVGQLSHHPMTWLSFPLQDLYPKQIEVEETDSEEDMSDWIDVNTIESKTDQNIEKDETNNKREEEIIKESKEENNSNNGNNSNKEENKINGNKEAIIINNSINSPNKNNKIEPVYKEEIDGYNRIVSKVPFVLNSRQLKHATFILKRVPELSKLRNFLCPKAMDDDSFWRVYFCLIKNQVKDVLQSNELDNKGWHQLALNNPKQQRTEKETKYLGLDWTNTDIQSEETQQRFDFRSLLKHLIKLPSFPVSRRAEVWLVSSGVQKMLKERPLFFEESVEHVFGKKVPPLINEIPYFGFPFNPKPFKTLSIPQIESAKRILVLIKMENDNYHYTPSLPNLTLLLLHHLTEKQTYLILHSFISKDSQRNFNNNSSSCLFFGSKKRSYVEMVHTFHCLVEVVLPAVYERLGVLGLHAQDFALAWFVKFFVGYLTNDCIFRLLDMFMLDGRFFVYRVALSILYINAGTLLECKTREEFLQVLKYLTKHPDTSVSLFTVACQMEIKKKTILQLDIEKRKEVGKIDEPKPIIYHYPKLEENSSIINSMQLERIWSWLPGRFKIRNPAFCFDSKKDGYSLITFYQKAFYIDASILLIKTSKGAIFGVFNTEKWEDKGDDYYGNGESFIFSLVDSEGNPNEVMYSWGCISPRLFIRSSRKEISVGVNAIWLNKDLLTGTSKVSATYNNQPLHGDPKSEEFRIASLELFSFVEPSKKVYDLHSY